jgi:Fe-S cluster assembly protein SufD
MARGGREGVRKMKELFLQQFERSDPAVGPGWLAKTRKGAIERFAALGLPTTEAEDWRYTSLEGLKDVAFQSPVKDDHGGWIENDFLERSAFCPKDAVRLVFVNGYYSPRLSSAEGLTPGVVVTSLASVLKSRPDLVEGVVGKVSDFRDRAFVALNTAFLNDGAVIHIPKKVVVERPIHVCHVSWMPEDRPGVSHPRNLIIAEEGAQATLVEIYLGGGKSTYFTNAVTEIIAGPGAVIDHYQLQQESGNATHLRSMDVRQEMDSRVSSLSVSLGAGLARNEVRTVLGAEGAECVLNGLTMVTGRQHADNQTSIDHAKPHGTSSELYKGILGGRSTGVFNGKIIVRPNAQKTVARQTNKNLLLSNEALVNTKPLLEIFANDVKCNHGATIGRLDDNQIFYLRSRGLNDVHARSLLTYAFASDLVTKIKVPTLKSGLEKWIFRRLMSADLPSGVSGGAA